MKYKRSGYLPKSGKIPDRWNYLCGQFQACFPGVEGIYTACPLTSVETPSSIKAFSLLIVRIGAFFYDRWHSSVSDAPLPHRAYSILPGWSLGEMAGRRQHTASYFLCITGLFLKACPMGEPQSETTCIIANRKCSGHRRIPPRHPAWCSFRYHNCSTHGLIFLPSGIGCNPWQVFCLLYASPPDCQKISLHYSVHFFGKNRGLFENFTKNSQFSLSEVAAPKFLHYSVHISGESCHLSWENTKKFTPQV